MLVCLFVRQANYDFTIIKSNSGKKASYFCNFKQIFHQRNWQQQSLEREINNEILNGILLPVPPTSPNSVKEMSLFPSKEKAHCKYIFTQIFLFFFHQYFLCVV